MQLRNKYYPYPVIIEDGDYYENSSFDSTVDQEMDGYNVKLRLKTSLNDKLMKEMITKGQLMYAHHIECPQTCYRRVVKTNSDDTTVIIKESEVNGLVQVCSFVVAIENIDKYTNESFAQDYRGWKFNIEKGCIMAIGNQYNLRINKIRDDLSNTSSIFSIVKNTDPVEDCMQFDLGQQKIIITLPEKSYNQYCSVQNNMEIQPVMHSMLIVPALIYAFTELKSAADQLYEYEEYRWFRGLKKACSLLGIQIDEESIKVIDVVKISQQLLKSPVTTAIEFCSLGGEIYED